MASFTGVNFVTGSSTQLAAGNLITLLPQTTVESTPTGDTLAVNSTAGFPSSGTLDIQTSAGMIEATYSSTSDTSFAGVKFISGPSSDNIVAQDPVTYQQQSYTVLDGSDGGVWRYNPNLSSNVWADLNANSSWTSGLEVSQFYGVVVNPNATGSQLQVYGGVQDNGNARTTIPAAGGGDVWQSATNDDGSLTLPRSESGFRSGLSLSCRSAARHCPRRGPLCPDHSVSNHYPNGISRRFPVLPLGLLRPEFE